MWVTCSPQRNSLSWVVAPSDVMREKQCHGDLWTSCPDRLDHEWIIGAGKRAKIFFVWTHVQVMLNSVWFSEIYVVWICHATLGVPVSRNHFSQCRIRRLCYWLACIAAEVHVATLMVTGQQATSQFVVMYPNTSQGFSCIIISSELLLERWHSDTCLFLMKRYDAPPI